MKSFLKYFVSILIVAISFIVTNTEGTYSTTDKEGKLISNELASFDTDLEELESDFYFPSQSLLPSTALRQNSFSKRVNNNHKNNLSFIEKGSTGLQGFSTFALNSPNTSKPSFTRSIHRLISFGKLII